MSDVINISHLAAQPLLQPIVRYVDVYRACKGCQPVRVTVSRQEFPALLKLARRHNLDPLAAGATQLRYLGIPVVSA